MALVIAHRGARSIAPENTLIAVEKAFQTGADLWETDVSITRDGRLVLFHDETLLRCTNAADCFPAKHPYLVRDFSLEELLRLDAGSFYIESDPFSQIDAGSVTREDFSEFRSVTIPTLMQGLEFTRKMNWKVNLELKDHTPGKIDFSIPDLTLDEIARSGIDRDRVVISSFNHQWLKRVGKAAPEIEIQALAGDNDVDPLDLGEMEFFVYNLNAKLVDDAMIEHLKNMGRKVNLFTINDPKTFRRFDSLGVDSIFTDFPQLFA